MKNLDYDKEYDIYVRKNQLKFQYSDGDAIENYIYNTLKSTDDTSIFSPTLRTKIKDWPSLYHFSSQRQNIMRPFNIGKGMKVLEIGGGCGAITRYLADTKADILSVEGSINRARSIRARCKDAANVKVVCSNVQDLEFEEKFDVITLIGVFEYSGKYSDFEKPYLHSLEFYKTLLKPTGKIVIAIENRLGLKYFCGYNEDHLGVPYKGLENNYGSSGIKTFGKKELDNLLQEAGFKDTDFYYPFPDYKLPKVILSEKGFSNQQFNSGDLLNQIDLEYYSGVTRINNSNPKLIWNYLDVNGVASDLSNSFIAVASAEQNDEFFNQELLGAHYNTQRTAQFNTETAFLEKDGKIVSSKTYLENVKDRNVNDKISHQIGTHPYVYGKNLGHQLYAAMQDYDKKSFEAHILIWITHLKQNALMDSSNPNSASKIKPVYFDGIPYNFILTNRNQLHYIDAEWKIDYEFTLGYLILRYLERIKMNKSFIKKYYSNYPSFIKSVFNIADLKPLSNEELQASLKREQEVHNAITPAKYYIKVKKRTIKRLKSDIKFGWKLIKGIFLKS